MLNLHTKCTVYLTNRIAQLITKSNISTLEEQA